MKSQQHPTLTTWLSSLALALPLLALGCSSSGIDDELFQPSAGDPSTGGTPTTSPSDLDGGTVPIDGTTATDASTSDPIGSETTPGDPVDPILSDAGLTDAPISDPIDASLQDQAVPDPTDPEDATVVIPTDPEPDLDLIDDFEDGDIAIYPLSGRQGMWYTYSDATPGEHASAPLPVADGAGRALHITGATTATTTAAYGGAGVDLANAGSLPTDPLRLAYDVSRFTGFSFRAKGQYSIRFEVVTRAVATTDERGTCTGSGCFDSHGKDVRLSTEWQEFRVPFSGLVQEGWGNVATFDPRQVMGVAFEHLGSGTYDFWVDDLRLYTEAQTDTGDVGTSTGTDCTDSWGGYSSGTITWYTFSQGTAGIGDVNCSFGIQQNPDRVNHVATGGGQYFAAMNTADYERAAACGACVEVNRIDTGRTVTVTVVDQCPVASNPKCVSGHVDLSLAAFEQLGPSSDGYVGAAAGRGQISWRYVPCPTTETVSFRLKEPSNAYWNEVIVEGHAYPIQSVQAYVDGTWMNASRAEYNYWLPPGGRMGSSPYRLRATDINGRSIEGSVTLQAGSQSTGQQFQCN